MADSHCAGNHCGRCCGGMCSGCSSSVLLSKDELEILEEFAQYSFLPVASDEDNNPVYRENNTKSETDYALVLSTMQKKGLIQINYDIPLLNYKYRNYHDCECFWSMALTTLGRYVIDQIENQGI